MKKFFVCAISLFMIAVMAKAQSYQMVIQKTSGEALIIPTDLVENVSFKEVQTFSISWDLNNVSASSNALQIAEGMPFTATLTPDEGYYIGNVSVVMGYYDITNSVYEKGSISIQEVTGNLIITATALKTSDGIDLSAKGTANCYIVTESGTFKFNIGNHSGVRAFLLWNELGADDITDVELQGDYIYFTKNDYAKGNAVISIVGANKRIAWSWHIWSTDEPAVITSPDGTRWMDRNLGATTSDYTSKDSYGMYYSYGNPMPFPGYKYKDFVITYNPSVPDGWYVAPGYGFYESSKAPSPDTPMQVCSSSDTYENSIFYRNPESPAPVPVEYNQPDYWTIQNAIGYEPIVDEYGIDLGNGLNFPLAGGHYNYGEQCPEEKSSYWCRGTWAPGYGRVVYFEDRLSKSYYCSVNAGCPIRVKKR